MLPKQLWKIGAGVRLLNAELMSPTIASFSNFQPYKPKAYSPTPALPAKEKDRCCEEVLCFESEEVHQDRLHCALALACADLFSAGGTPTSQLCSSTGAKRQ